eukprot:2849890-Amphidinium_carterae.1
MRKGFRRMVVAKGAQARSTAATGVHAHSSRSHALLMLEIEHRWKSRPDDEAVKSQVARLTLVDLAGVEGQRTFEIWTLSGSIRV